MLVVKDPSAGSPELGYVRRALEQDELVVIPTDTVYGIAALATSEAAVRRLYELKGRGATQPTAVAFATVDALLEQLPELSVRARWAVRSLLPGPWTLVVENPSGQMPWLTGGVPGPIGVRVPAGALELPPIAATSANEAGEPTIEQVRDIPPRLAGGIACAVDRGVLLGSAESTVLDLTAWERSEGDVSVIRDTRERAGQALATLASAP
jgi:L-threonylcarbamoyladenylate synthase